MDEQIQTEGVQAPLHRRIAESLSNQVSGGALKPGEKLASERQIARQFQASRATVRTALQNMEQAGLITRRERRSAPGVPFVQRRRGEGRSCFGLVGGFEAGIVQPQHRAIGEHQEEDETGDEPDGPAGDFDDQCHGASLFGSALAAACGH